MVWVKSGHRKRTGIIPSEVGSEFNTFSIQADEKMIIVMVLRSFDLNYQFKDTSIVRREADY